MKKVEIYDPAMCCSTGVCGPSVDPELTKVASAIYSLEKRGCDIKRYNLANEPAAFADNEKVSQILQESGADALPLVLIDGDVFKKGSYPSIEELAAIFNIDKEELMPKKPKTVLDVTFHSKEEE
ncbi:arsenite efflux transporter metallochaperone ArsD [Bacillus atrophaeus]|uniref:arsenite efflux transporter metallochaperone ArsD n=1 Tax=Bacillus atrophaeus TaxID=1452 RepID=UPI001EFBD92C|nr:arsenite efflux transporter metallochaperone ArsD [Bacillus atrophaeus]